MRGRFASWPAAPDLAVYAGCARPMVRPQAAASAIHGDALRDRLHLPEPAMPLQALHGVDFLIDSLRAAEPGSITVCALGPLTDIAMALVKAPDIAGRIGELVVMGGAGFEIGNITPAAEFNIHADPHAAEIVLESGIPVIDDPARRHPSGAQHAAADRGPGGARQSLRAGGRRVAGGFRADPRQQVRDARNRAARPMRRRLSAVPGAVRRAARSISRSRPPAR